MKKILCALISTAMLFGLISCGQSAPPSQTGPGNSQGTQQGTEAPPAAPQPSAEEKLLTEIRDLLKEKA